MRDEVGVVGVKWKGWPEVEEVDVVVEMAGMEEVVWMEKEEQSIKSPTECQMDKEVCTYLLDHQLQSQLFG